ncbi:MAG: mandelate racemase/muconate lactonizing enzyme family protein, partial [Quisquiliibacterium sp.]
MDPRPDSAKIIEVSAIALSYRLPEGKTVKLGVGATTKRDAIIVRVRTDQGITGYGEAHPGRSPGAVVSLVEKTLAPMIRGMDACDVVGVWARVNRMQLSSHGLGAGAALALSGIDMALWDIRGKLAGMPLYRLLGGSRKRVPAYAGGISLGFQEPASLVDEAREYIARGYRAVKLRLGDNPRDDIARVTAVREG